jgi:hypothetical protein
MRNMRQTAGLALIGPPSVCVLKPHQAPENLDNQCANKGGRDAVDCASARGVAAP